MKRMITMSDKTIAQKLLIKEGYKVLLVNPPSGYKTLLGPLTGSVTILKSPAVASADLVQVFVKGRKELEAQLGKLKKALNPKGLLWVTYYKGTAKRKTDINRDTINAYAKSLGLEGVAMISVDDDWSALRLKIIS